jgi:DNA-binding GntR family transcriptional regulator
LPVFEAIAAGDAERARLRMAEVLDEVEHAIDQLEPTAK